MAMYEEPDEVYALFDYVSEHYLESCAIRYGTSSRTFIPSWTTTRRTRAVLLGGDVQAADQAVPQETRRPGAGERILLERHDCGKSECFIDDWLEIGIKSWNPAQVSNDLVTIKKKYTGRLTLAGCWDNQGVLGSPAVDEEGSARGALQLCGHLCSRRQLRIQRHDHGEPGGSPDQGKNGHHQGLLLQLRQRLL